MSANQYLVGILQKYAQQSLSGYLFEIVKLKGDLRQWASGCFLEIIDSGSRAKGTAIKLASDFDLFVSLTVGCNENNGGLQGIYDSLFTFLNEKYSSARKQSVSIRINLDGLSVDVTPGRKQNPLSSDHSLWVSKRKTWTKTNVQKHNKDISWSGRTDEIKLLKIWRELHSLEFCSIYLEYLVLKILGSSRGTLEQNFTLILTELAKDTGNPMFLRLEDPANSSNDLADELTLAEINSIRSKAKQAVQSTTWATVVW